MGIYDITREDALKLLELMQRCDDAFYEVADRWSDVFEPDVFAVIKASILFWSRVEQELGLAKNHPLKMPVLNTSKITGDDVDDEITDYIYSESSYADPSSEILYKVGISMDFSELYPGALEQFIEDAKEAAAEEGSQLSDEAAREMGEELLAKTVLPELYTHLPDITKDLISFVENWQFCAEDITFYSSERVGRFVKNKMLLENRLPKETYQAVMVLVNVVFEPLYFYFPDLTASVLGLRGEYCGLCTCGYFEYEGETITPFHKRPYAELAVALLDRFLSEAEQLAPDILLTSYKLAG